MNFKSDEISNSISTTILWCPVHDEHKIFQQVDLDSVEDWWKSDFHLHITSYWFGINASAMIGSCNISIHFYPLSVQIQSNHNHIYCCKICLLLHTGKKCTIISPVHIFPTGRGLIWPPFRHKSEVLIIGHGCP